MRVVALVKLLHQLTNLILGAACFVAAWSLATGAGWYGVACVVICLSTAATVIWQRKGSRTDRRIGRWEEQQYVLMSMLEAMDRGMSAGEWLDRYVERAAADRLPSRP